MVVHLLVPAGPVVTATPRIGFVVSRAVGPAVTRNQVKRRLRHLARQLTDSLPPHGMLVVRALPAAATATYAELSEELDRCLDKARGGSAVSSAKGATP
jgi:ribonuclease P protein component